MAIFGALACLAHCIALPVLLAFLPALTAVTPLPTTFHIIALAFAIPTTALALWVGYRRHREAMPLLVGLLGLTLLAIGVLVFGEGRYEAPVTILGSIGIVSAHVANWRFRRMATHA